MVQLKASITFGKIERADQKKVKATFKALLSISKLIKLIKLKHQMLRYEEAPLKSWVDAPCTFRIWRSIVWKYIAHKDAAWKVCPLISNQIDISALQVYCVEVQENPERSTDNVAPTGNLLLRHIWGDWFPINIILLLKEGNLLEISWSLGLLIC